MSTNEHFDGSPASGIGRLAAACGLDPGRLDMTAAHSIDAADLACDLAFEFPLRDPEPGGPRGVGFIIEIQEQIDRRKELSWPQSWAYMRARPGVHGGPVWLLVITFDTETERWVRATLHCVIPAAGRGLVLGPSTMPRITDPHMAERDPEIALVSALIHAGEGDAAFVPAIAVALPRLPEGHRMRLYTALLTRLSRPALTLLETTMQQAGDDTFAGFVDGMCSCID